MLKVELGVGLEQGWGFLQAGRRRRGWTAQAKGTGAPVPVLSASHLRQTRTLGGPGHLEATQPQTQAEVTSGASRFFPTPEPGNPTNPTAGPTRSKVALHVTTLTAAFLPRSRTHDQPSPPSRTEPYWKGPVAMSPQLCHGAGPGVSVCAWPESCATATDLQERTRPARSTSEGGPRSLEEGRGRKGKSGR